MLTATATLPLWNYIAKRLNKHHAYVIGMMFWIVVQLLILTIKTGDINYILFLAVLAGISVSNAHVIPEAMFPDVIEWDELRNNTRREGMYYGAN